MNTTKRLITMALAILTVAALAMGPASANPYEDANTIDVVVDVAATSREGNVLFGYRRTHATYTASATEYVPAPSRSGEILTHISGCPSNYLFEGQAFVAERRADGAARVSLLIGTWDGQCSYPGPGHTSSWGQRYVWVQPNDSATIVIHVGSSGGSARAEATFTNNWNPLTIDLPISKDIDNTIPEDDDSDDKVVVKVDEPVFLEPSVWNGFPLPDLTKLVTKKMDF